MTDTAKLCDEDYFARQTDKPIRITVTFDDLSEKAKTELANYVRQNELVVTAEAIFDPGTGIGQVRHFGQRLGITRNSSILQRRQSDCQGRGTEQDLCRSWSRAFQACQTRDLRTPKPMLFGSTSPRTQTSAASFPARTTFMGSTARGKWHRSSNGFTSRRHADEEEGQEAKNTAFGKLIARTVRSRTNFDKELEKLKQEALTSYKKLLDENRASLDDISDSLQKRLESWAHPNVRIQMDWLSDPSKSIQVTQPVAGIKTGDRDFLGSLARMGHGLQRSYLLALLQELASSDAPDAPTMLLACRRTRTLSASAASKTSCGRSRQARDRQQSGRYHNALSSVCQWRWLRERPAPAAPPRRTPERLSPALRSMPSVEGSERHWEMTLVGSLKA